MPLNLARTLLALTLGTSISSCALQRHAKSGYSQPKVIFKTGQRPPSLGTDVSLSDSKTLKILESNLRTEQEIKQYYNYKPLLKTDQRRIAFLQQQGIQNRNLWVERFLFPKEERDFNEKELKMISNRDITIGMSRSAVRESWGTPTETKVAGNPVRGNEQWVYKKLVPTSNGYKTEYRHVFFETGHVAGWETK